jgi:hypothetical protein
VWPNFLIIGANRSGTTSLFHYLRQHPEIYLSPGKEPMFFTLYGTPPDPRRPDAATTRRGVFRVEDYLALFEGVTAERAVGEASTSYLADPRAPARIRHHIPAVRLFAILRQPAERAYSAYRYHVRHGMESLANFADAVRSARNPGDWRGYVAVGHYHRHLRRYYATFERSQIFVYLYEDLQTRPAWLIGEICRALGVADSFLPDMSIRHNASTDGRPPSRAFRFWDRVSRRARHQPAADPGMSREVREELNQLYRGDILALQDLIGRDLSHWLT